MARIHILKPGCNPSVVREGKTNLQLRELQMLRSALLELNVDSDIITVDELASKYDTMHGDTFFVFNSAKVFDDELNRMLTIFSMLPSCSIYFVSNDCRLTFETDKYDVWYKLAKHAIDKSKYNVSIHLLTNATAFLDDYAKLVIPQLANFIPVMHMPFDMLPCWLKHYGDTVDKTTDFVYTCMHFKDYDNSRQLALTELANALQNSIAFIGDMQGMQVNGEQVPSNVIDAKDISKCYALAKVAVTLLEHAYESYGVMPNRLAEALMNNCCVAILAYDTTSFLYSGWFTVASNMPDYIHLLMQLAEDDDYRNMMLEKQQAKLQQRRALLLDRLKLCVSKYQA